MRARTHCPSRVVQKQSEIKHERFFQIFEKTAIGDQLRIVCPHQRVEFVDAKQRMLVRGVTMKKFLLHQASQWAELRNIATEKINPVLHPQRPPDLTLFP